MSDAKIGYGSVFRRLVDSTYEALAEITNISGPELSKDAPDATSNDSSDGYREFIPGLRDAGQVTLEMNFTRDTYDTLLTDYEADTTHEYEIVFADAENTSVNFTGIVTALSITAPLDDKISASATFKISGKPNVNSGSGSS